MAVIFRRKAGLTTFGGSARQVGGGEPKHGGKQPAVTPQSIVSAVSGFPVFGGNGGTYFMFLAPHQTAHLSLRRWASSAAVNLVHVVFTLAFLPFPAIYRPW